MWQARCYSPEYVVVLSKTVRIGGVEWSEKWLSEVLNLGHGESVVTVSWLGDTDDEFCCDELSLRSIMANNQL